MKHTLICGAAALAMAAPALAQSNVTLFGVADIGVARVSAANGSVTGVSTGGANISRFGFRGTEDLGGGLKAGFWLEGGLDIDTGAGKASGAFSHNRRATASLMGGFGEVRLGRDDAASFLNTLIFDPFLTNGVGGTMSFFMRTGAPIIQLSNAISYFLPANLGGFYGQFQHAFGEAATGSAGDYNGLRAGWRGGPVHVAGAAGKLKGATSATDISLSNFGLSYDLGVARPMLLWAKEKQGSTSVTALQLGVVAPVGPGQLRASVGRYDTSGGNNDWTKFGLGYGYDLSKRTQLYASVARISNKSGATKAIGVQGLAAPGNTAGHSASGYEMGLRHNF